MDSTISSQVRSTFYKTYNRELGLYASIQYLQTNPKILHVEHDQQTLLGSSPPRNPEPKLLKFNIVVDTILSIASAVKNAW